MPIVSDKMLGLGAAGGTILTVAGLASRTCIKASNPLLAAPWCGDAGASHSMAALAHCAGCYAAAFGAMVLAASLAALTLRKLSELPDATMAANAG